MTPLMKQTKFPKNPDSDALTNAQLVYKNSLQWRPSYNRGCTKKIAIVTPLRKQKMFPKIRDNDALNETDDIKTIRHSDAITNAKLVYKNSR